MAVDNCECELIISTSSDRPRCLRCLRVLGPQHCADMPSVVAVAAVATAMAAAERPRQLCQVTIDYRLNERPVIAPVPRLPR